MPVKVKSSSPRTVVSGLSADDGSLKVKSTSPRTVVSEPTNRNQVSMNQSNLFGRTLGALVDVDTSNAVDGSVLVYDEIEEKFLATTLLEKQTVNGGHF